MPENNGYEPRFDIDLERGRTGELFVLDICHMLAKRSATIEVKTDDRYADTGRLYVEHECRGRDGVWRPSGLVTTKAKLWAFVVNKQTGVLIYDTEWLRRAVSFAQHLGNKAEHPKGETPTKGICVGPNHFFLTASPSWTPKPGKETWHQMWARPYVPPA